MNLEKQLSALYAELRAIEAQFDAKPSYELKHRLWDKQAEISNFIGNKNVDVPF